MTVVLTASAAVQCGQTYHVKMGVSNVNDSWFQSAVFLEQGSFTSSDRFSLTVDSAVNVEYNATDTTLIEYDCDSVYLRFNRLGGFYLDEDLQVSVEGTATNGVDGSVNTAATFALDLNVTAMYRMIRAFLPAMLSNGGGSIINMASVASSIKGVPNRFAYCASKGAVIGLTRAVAADFVSQNIRCNAICPGTVDSPSLRQRITEQALREQRSEAEVYAAFVSRQPMGRIGSAQEIAQLALYLGSSASGFTTGTTQIIDGGWSN